MTQKEVFKSKIIELFNSVLPNNAIDEYSLDIVQTKHHTTLFSLLNHLEESDLPPVCTRETDDAVHVIYPDITFIFPYDFKTIKLFYNSDVKIYIKHPEYIELGQLADFLMQIDSEMVHWKKLWKYFHDLEMLKVKGNTQLDERSRKLINNITYPFEGKRIDRQRLQFYNIQASRLFLENENFDYVYQKSEDSIIERCKAHNISPDTEEWRQRFDDILKQRELEYLIAEEKRKALIRRNTKIRHLLALGHARLKAALAGIDFNDIFRVNLYPVRIDLTLHDHELQTENYYIDLMVNGTADIRLTFPYIRLNDMITRLVETLESMNSLMPELQEELRKNEGKYMIARSYYQGKNPGNYPYCLEPVLHNTLHWYQDYLDMDTKIPDNEVVKKLNSIVLQLREDIGKPNVQ